MLCNYNNIRSTQQNNYPKSIFLCLPIIGLFTSCSTIRKKLLKVHQPKQQFNTVLENIHAPHRRDMNLMGWGSVRLNNLKKCMKIEIGISRGLIRGGGGGGRRGGGSLTKKIPSMGEVQIFSGTTHYQIKLGKHEMGDEGRRRKSYKKNPFHGRGTDIFWNYTLSN